MLHRHNLILIPILFCGNKAILYLQEKNISFNFPAFLGCPKNIFPSNEKVDHL